MSDGLDLDAMLARFKERAAAVKRRQMPPVEGEARKDFVRQAQLDYQDYALIADSSPSVTDGVLTFTIDLRASDDDS
jgi:hypothetical protein